MVEEGHQREGSQHLGRCLKGGRSTFTGTPQALDPLSASSSRSIKAVFDMHWYTAWGTKARCACYFPFFRRVPGRLTDRLQTYRVKCQDLGKFAVLYHNAFNHLRISVSEYITVYYHGLKFTK